MSAAIYFLPEAYTTAGPKVMGRNSAGESFLQGFATHSKATEFWAMVEKRAHAAPFMDALRAAGRNEAVNIAHKGNMKALTQPGVVYFPEPDIGTRAWHRAAFGHDAWSLCGITHTVCTTAVMDALTNLIAAPVQPWDAVICTSTAVRDNVTRLLGAQFEYLQQRLGATRQVLPQLPVIPLGIDTARFAGTAAQRAAARDFLGVDDATIVVLFLGRLSFHAKAHPLPQYLALEKAARATGNRIVLVECGRHASPAIGKAFAEAAQFACPSVRVVTLDSSDAGNRQHAWAVADIFSSLSDNLQESFGLTPLEAMAAGLPLVVSDWDGYKDTVRDQVDGFRVPTLMPHAGLGADLALRHALDLDSYDRYCGYTSQLIAVDVDATAAAFIRLIRNPQLRRQMGDAGRKRAREHYDWSVIIPRYETLWAELTELRKARSTPAARAAPPWPARMDPFHAFAAYPTHILAANTRMQLAGDGAADALQRALALRALKMVEYAQNILPNDAELEAVLLAVAAGPQTAETLSKEFPRHRRPVILRGLVWLAKMGILSRAP